MSMLLKGQNGNEFELSFVRNSFADVQDGTGDSAWGTVAFRAATADESWEESAPCLSTFGFDELAGWMEAVGGKAGAEPEVAEIELLEPELKFSVADETSKGVTIRVGFHLADRPEEFGVDTDTDEADYIDLFVPRPNVLAAAQTLRKMLDELNLNTLKDDIDGDADFGILGEPDDDLNIVDDIRKNPPGAGTGEDNAGQR